MSRYAPKSIYCRKNGNYTIWVGRPKRHYIVTTDQGTLEHDAIYLDYKGTIANLKKAGYTNINISCVGYTRKGV